MYNSKMQRNNPFFKPLKSVIKTVLNPQKTASAATKNMTSATTQQTTSTKQSANKPLSMSHINRQDAEAEQAKKPHAKTPASAATKNITSATTQQTTSTKQSANKPLPMSHINRQDAEAEQVKKPNAKAPVSAGNAVRQKLTDDKMTPERRVRLAILHEPIDNNSVRSGTLELGDSWRNPLNPRGAFVKNGVKPRGENDTGTGGDTPIRFAGTSDEEKRRQYESAMKRAASASKDLYQMMEWAKIDANNLTAEQDEVIDLVKRDLIKKSVLGTLTADEKQKILQRTQRYIYNETTSANGDPYPVYIDIVSGGNQLDDMFPALGTVDTSVLSEEELKMVLEYGEQETADENEHKIFQDMRKYKDRVTWDAIYAYNKDIALGRAEPGDLQDYYDQAVKKVYDNCIKPIPITYVVDGKRTNLNILIGELIPPNDNTFGAQVAREATRLLGLGYNEKAGQGYYSNMNIDCSKLVVWAVSEADPNIGIYGLSKKAEYQMAAIEDTIWPNEKNEEVYKIKLFPGDTLYWKGDESGEIKHTAIYIGRDKDDKPLMIEAGTSVRIVPIREHTPNSNGEGSTLYQIKRMSWKGLRTNAAKNKNKH